MLDVHFEAAVKENQQGRDIAGAGMGFGNFAVHQGQQALVFGGVGGVGVGQAGGLRFFPSEVAGHVELELRQATPEAAYRFLDALRLILPATTLGDVYSLALYPVMASHRAVPPAERARLGIGDGLLRLSIGIEDPADILADLDQALAAIAGEP